MPLERQVDLVASRRASARAELIAVEGAPGFCERIAVPVACSLELSLIAFARDHGRREDHPTGDELPQHTLPHCRTCAAPSPRGVSFGFAER